MTTPFEDREQIRTLTARYNIAADSGDLDGFCACFTEDGIFEIAGLVKLQGHDALRAIISAIGITTHHMTTDSVITVDGDTATQVCSFVLYGRTEDDTQMSILTTSRYFDRLGRVSQLIWGHGCSVES